MMRQIQCVRRLHERIRHAKIGHRRKFDRRIFAARALHADGAGCDDNVATFHIQLHAAAGAHAHKGVGASHHELLQRDRRRRSADACRGDTDFFAIERARVGHKLAAVGDELWIVKIRRDLRTALGIARQEHIAPNVPAPHLQMIKFFLIFRIIDHEITSFRMVTSIPENPPRNLTKIAKKKSSPRRARFSVVFSIHSAAMVSTMACAFSRRTGPRTAKTTATSMTARMVASSCSGSVQLTPQISVSKLV